MNFIRAPFVALQLGGTQGDNTLSNPSTVSNSGFRTRIFGAKPKLQQPDRTANGHTLDKYLDVRGPDRVWHNSLAYTGGAAVAVWNGYRSVIAGNYLALNRI